MVSLSIFKCGSGIIVLLLESRPLGRLPVWEKFAYKDGMNWPDGLEGPDRTRQGRGGATGFTVAGAGSEVPQLALEVMRVEGYGGCHQFHWYCRGRGVFVPVQQINCDTLHTNPNCLIVQASTKST